MGSISSEETDDVIQKLQADKEGEMVDVFSLIDTTSIEDRIDAKKILRKMVDQGLVIQYPGSKYKIKPEAEKSGGTDSE